MDKLQVSSANLKKTKADSSKLAVSIDKIK